MKLGKHVLYGSTELIPYKTDCYILMKQLQEIF